jgi:endonuclease-3
MVKKVEAKIAEPAVKKAVVKKGAVKTTVVKEPAAKKVVAKKAVDASIKKAGLKGAAKKKGSDTKQNKKAMKSSGTVKKLKGPQEVVLVPRAIAHKEMDILCHTYPEADCELDFKTDFQLLIAVILSAQSTDVTINKVTAELFKHYPTAETLAEADIEHVKKLIKASGFFNAKAKNIQNCAQTLVTKYGGKVPVDHDALTELPGVGRKTANVVLGVAHNIPGWSVDTHVQRLSRRLGFTEESDPYKIELDLQKLFPKQDWSKLSITIIWHGRRLCFARKPDCPRCPLKDICPSSEA